jgi:hypothetical protein
MKCFLELNMLARLIENDQEYREARQMLLDLVRHDPAPGTPEDDRLLELASGIERYEVQHILDLPAGARRTIVASHQWTTEALEFNWTFQQVWERRRLRFALGLDTPLSRDDREVLLRGLPVIGDAGDPYAVRIADVPPPLQSEIREWWRMWGLPLFTLNGGDCIYVWDWSDWLNGLVPDLP